MARDNILNEKDKYKKGELVFFWIFSKLRKTGENKYIYCYIIILTQNNYQFNFYFRLISGRYPHSKLNIIDNFPRDGTIPRIEKLTLEEVIKISKMILSKIILFINNK
jgi:hypothetical protein